MVIQDTAVHIIQTSSRLNATAMVSSRSSLPQPSIIIIISGMINACGYSCIIAEGGKILHRRLVYEQYMIIYSRSSSFRTISLVWYVRACIIYCLVLFGILIMCASFLYIHIGLRQPN